MRCELRNMITPLLRQDLIELLSDTNPRRACPPERTAWTLVVREFGFLSIPKFNEHHLTSGNGAGGLKEYPGHEAAAKNAVRRNALPNHYGIPLKRGSMPDPMDFGDTSAAQWIDPHAILGVIDPFRHCGEDRTQFLGIDVQFKDRHLDPQPNPFQIFGDLGPAAIT